MAQHCYVIRTLCQVDTMLPRTTHLHGAIGAVGYAEVLPLACFHFWTCRPRAFLLKQRNERI